MTIDYDEGAENLKFNVEKAVATNGGAPPKESTDPRREKPDKEPAPPREKKAKAEKEPKGDGKDAGEQPEEVQA